MLLRRASLLGRVRGRPRPAGVGDRDPVGGVEPPPRAQGASRERAGHGAVWFPLQRLQAAHLLLGERGDVPQGRHDLHRRLPPLRRHPRLGSGCLSPAALLRFHHFREEALHY